LCVYIYIHILLLFLSVDRIFVKVPPSHMIVLPGHYKGLHTRSKVYTHKSILVAAMGKPKQANESYQHHHVHKLLSIHEPI